MTLSSKRRSEKLGEADGWDHGSLDFIHWAHRSLRVSVTVDAAHVASFGHSIRGVKASPTIVSPLKGLLELREETVLHPLSIFVRKRKEGKEGRKEGCETEDTLKEKPSVMTENLYPGR